MWELLDQKTLLVWRREERSDGLIFSVRSPHIVAFVFFLETGLIILGGVDWGQSDILT